MLNGLRFRQPQRYGLSNMLPASQPEAAAANDPRKAMYEQAVRQAASDAFGGVLPQSVAQPVYQAARAIQDANPFSTPIEELLRPKGLVEPGSEGEVAALAAKIPLIRAESKSEDEVAARIGVELDLIRQEAATKTRTQEQDIAGVTGAEAAIRSQDVGAAVGRSVGDFAQMILNIEAGQAAGLPMPAAMGAQSAIVPAIKEAQGGPEAEGTMLGRFGEGVATGGVLQALGHASKFALDKAIKSTTPAAELLKHTASQGVVGAGIGFSNAPPGEEMRQAGVEGILNAALTAASGGRYMLGRKMMGEPTKPGVETPYVPPKEPVGNVATPPPAPSVVPEPAPAPKVRPKPFAKRLENLDIDGLNRLRADDQVIRSIADEYSQRPDSILKAIDKRIQKLQPPPAQEAPAATTKVPPIKSDTPGKSLGDYLSAMSPDEFQKIGVVELRDMANKYGVKRAEAMTAIEKEVMRRTGEVIPRGTKPDKAKSLSEKDIADGAADVPADQQVRHMYSGIPYHELKEMAVDVAHGIRDAALMFTEATRPRFWNVMKRDPAAGRLAVEDVAAPEHSKTTAKLWHDTMRRMAADEGKISAYDDLPKLLYEEQARAISERNAAIKKELVAKAGREDIFLTPEERKSLTRAKQIVKRSKDADAVAAAQEIVDTLGPRRDAHLKLTFRERRALKAAGRTVNIPRIADAEYQAMKSDPVVQKLLDYYEREVLGEINSLGQSSGIKGKRNTRYYMQLRPLTEETHREYLKSGKNAIVTGVTRNVPGQYRTKTARAARMATGGAFSYGMDMRDLLENMHRDRWSATTRNNIIGYMKRNAVAPDIKTKRIPSKVMYGGKEVPVVALKLGEDKVRRFIIKDKDGTPKIGSKLVERGTVMVPEPLKKLYDEVVNIRASYGGAGSELGNKAHSFLVGMQLATPAEAVWHANSLLSLLSTLPDVNKNLLVRFGSDPVRFMGAMAEVYNLHGPDAINDYKELSRLGGIRGEGIEAQGAMAKAMHSIPISKQAREFVFDAPNLSEKGLRGIEAKSRLVLYRALKKLGVSPTEAAFVTNNKFGTYIQKLQPELARSWVRYFDPFVNFGIAKVKAGVNKMVGRGPLGFDKSSIGELLFNTWVMTPAVMAVVQRISDPEGRWPWDIPGLPVGYIRVEKNKQGVIDIPFARIMANTWWRSLRHTGISGIMESYVNGNSDAADLASGWARSAINANLGRMGAIPRMSMTAITGRIPYLGNDFMPMQIVPQSGTTNFDQLKENMSWTASHFWSPFGEASTVLGEGGRVPASDSQAQQALRVTLAILGFLPRYGSTEEQALVGKIRGVRGRVGAIQRDITSRARRLFGPDDIDRAEEWIREQIDDKLSGLPEDEREMAFARTLKDYVYYNANTQRYMMELEAQGDE